jgi:aminocarboxymuconate-semialdehyde decarboxylase
MGLRQPVTGQCGPDLGRMEDYWLTALVGFLFDTTLAAAHLTFAGVPERYPNITWVLTHMGGALPYLAERCDRGYEAFADCRRNISKPPTEYFKQFYYDTVNFNPDAIEFAIKFAGADHILAGSDYPHQIGSIPKMLDALSTIQVSDEERRQILGGNAARVLGLNP